MLSALCSLGTYLYPIFIACIFLKVGLPSLLPYSHQFILLLGCCPGNEITQNTLIYYYLRILITLFRFSESEQWSNVAVLNTYKVVDKLTIIVCAFCDSESNVFVPNWSKLQNGCVRRLLMIMYVTTKINIPPPNFVDFLSKVGKPYTFLSQFHPGPHPAFHRSNLVLRLHSYLCVRQLSMIPSSAIIHLAGFTPCNKHTLPYFDQC